MTSKFGKEKFLFSEKGGEELVSAKI